MLITSLTHRFCDTTKERKLREANRIFNRKKNDFRALNTSWVNGTTERVLLSDKNKLKILNISIFI